MTASEKCGTLLHIFSPIRCFKQGLVIRPGNGQYELLDFLRALSVLWLVCFHVFFVRRGEEEAWYNGFAQNGHLSVDAFLLISGFLIGIILIKEQDKYNRRLDYKRFAFRRIVRIYPLLLGVLAFYWLYTADPSCDKYWWTTVFFLNNIDAIVTYDDLCMHWTWSLSLEMQFYFIAAVILGLTWRHHKLQLYSCWFMIFGTFLARLITAIINEEDFPMHAKEFNIRGTTWARNLYLPPWTRMGSLFIGVVTAIYYHRSPKPFPNHYPKLKFLSIILCCVILVIYTLPNWSLALDEQCEIDGEMVFSQSCNNQKLNIGFSIFIISIYRHLFTGCCALLLFWGLIRCRDNESRPLWLRFMLHHTWYVLAQISYGIYLINGIIVYGVRTFLPMVLTGDYAENRDIGAAWLFLECVVSILICIIVSFFLYILLEKPTMDLRDFSKIEGRLRKERELKQAEIESVPSMDTDRTSPAEEDSGPVTENNRSFAAV